MSVRALLLPLPLLAAGCASTEASYPSLAPRVVETLSTAPEGPRPPVVTAPADPAATARLAALGKAVDDAAAGFDAVLPGARATAEAARGSQAGDERWVRAQQALGHLNDAREPLADALAELDALRLDAEQATERRDTTALEALWARAGALQASHDQAYQTLAALLPD